MPVIGIISKNENIIEIEENLIKYGINEKNIIIINEQKIANVCNVKFDILIIYEEITTTNVLKDIINNTKYIILNNDFKNNLVLDNNYEVYVITYGFNSKSTIMIISNENDEIILEIQREIEDLKKRKIDVQEIKFEKKLSKKHIYEEIAFKILTILCRQNKNCVL